MTPFSAGEIMGGSDGCVHVNMYGAQHYICPEELGMLFFAGDSVPLLKNFPSGQSTPQLSGRVRLNASGRSVIIEIGAARFMVPRDRFLAVAFGEDISCIIFEIPSEKNGIAIISPKGGTA
jgi:hypothetical protein